MIDNKGIPLAKGDLYPEQTFTSHSQATREIAKLVAELRKFDEVHSRLLALCAIWHDVGKEVLSRFKGSHKLPLDECVNELRQRIPEADETEIQVVAHCALTHHYTSRQDLLELTKIPLPPHINVDLLLRYLRACDQLASIHYLDLANLDSIQRWISPLELMAYTISREGIIAGKIMDLIDEYLSTMGGRGIYYHNGSIFLFKEDVQIDVSEIRKKITGQVRSMCDGLFQDVVNIRGNPRGIVIAPIQELDGSNFERVVWPKILETFESKRNAASRRREDDRQKGVRNAYLLVQKAISEIFEHFAKDYSLSAPSQRFSSTRTVLTPIESEMPKSILDKEFSELSYDDFAEVGKKVTEFIRQQEKDKPKTAKTSLAEEASEQALNILTFTGEKPPDIEGEARAIYEEYLQVAQAKSIGAEGEKEFCFFCGATTDFSFRAAMLQKIKISKIFSERRPALAPNIENVKICPLCIAEQKSLESHLPAELTDLLFLYIEKPATLKPPYLEIKETFLDTLSSIMLGDTVISREEFDAVRYYQALLEQQRDNATTAYYRLSTNHFYLIIGELPKNPNNARRNLGVQESVLYLLPFLHALIEVTHFSVRVDLAPHIDFAPVYRLLEVPPLAAHFSGEEFGKKGRLFKQYVLPVKLWHRLRMGSLIDFAKRFPREWPNFLARVLQDDETARFHFTYLKEKYQILKEIYPMKESEILQSALAVAEHLQRSGFSRYAITRPIQIAAKSILEATRGNFDDTAVIGYAVNRVLTLSQREIGREIREARSVAGSESRAGSLPEVSIEAQEPSSIPEEIRAEIKESVERLVKHLYTYYRGKGFKQFILLQRYLSDAVLVESRFSQ